MKLYHQDRINDDVTITDVIITDVTITGGAGMAQW